MRKINPKNLLFFLFWIFLPFWINAQSDLPTPENPESDFVLEEFTLPGGTNGNLVTSIVEGPNGFTWFGTFGGLHRYDGYEFKTYTKNPADTIAPTQSLQFNNIEHLFWDSQDKLWVSTFGGGLFRFDPVTEVFQHFQHNPTDSLTISSPFVQCAVEDKEGILWFATRNGVDKFDRQTQQFERLQLDPTKTQPHQNNNARVLYIDRQGTLWVAAGEFFRASNQGGLYRFNAQTNTFIHYPPDPTNPKGLGHAPIRGIYEDQQGNFWIGAYEGLYKMNREEETFEKMAYHPNQPHAPEAASKSITPVWSFLEDQNQGLWIGTLNLYGAPPTNTLLRYDPIQKTTEELPLNTYAWQLHESTDGTIWAAGSAISGNVTRITRKAKEYDLQEGTFLEEGFQNHAFFQNRLFLSNNLQNLDVTIDPTTGALWVRAAYVDSDSTYLFLATENRKTGKAELFELKDLPLKFGDETSGFSNVGMVVGQDGKIWSVIDKNGIFSFDPNTQAIKQYKHNPLDSNSLSSNEIVRMIMDSKGDLWAAGPISALNRLNPTTGKITRYDFPIVKGMPTNGVFPIALLEDKTGSIWVGGTVRLEQDNSTLPFLTIINPATNEQTAIPLPKETDKSSVRFLTQDPVTGNIAFTLFQYGFGVYNIKKQRIDLYNPEVGNFPINQVAALLFDEAGMLWAASREVDAFSGYGFARIDLEKEDIFLFGSTFKPRNDNRNAFVGPEGQLYFKNPNGWSKINPENILPPAAVKQASIKLVELEVAGEIQNPVQHQTLTEPIYQAKTITLNHNDEAFSFQFSDFNFKKGNSNFHYRLLPYETQWKTTSGTPIANYFKVPSGNYELQVRAREEKGAKIKPLTVQVIITPPWWNTWWAYGLYGLGAIAFFYFVHSFQKERVIRAERERNRAKELAQAKEIEKAYNELKATQAQLIHAEKMASLGELTAGIAHEIQNPLNFVNNFAEVSQELLEEMQEELDNGDMEEVKDIAKDVISNLGKIHHHGKRADSIVKGMLQHSRTSSGKIAPTNINNLADEYLRLAYHGIRAKDKSFNAKMHTDFDETIGKIKVVPQDMGRVILNLITNAFYAVNERRKAGIEGYEPKVSVSTKRVDSPLGMSGLSPRREKSGGKKGENGQIEICVTDNGNGIPKQVKAKIFQPFFTTKPTGQGTGLGLSLSYDIVQAHGGELLVESEEGVGTTFRIVLPKSN